MTAIGSNLPISSVDAYGAALRAAEPQPTVASQAEQPFSDFAAFAGSGDRFGLGQAGAADPAGVARQVLGLIAQG